MKPSKKLLKSSLLKDFPNLIHGFTTRKAGDFRYGNLDRLAKIFKINPKDIITMSQVHGKDIVEITDGFNKKKEVDGIITTLKNKFLVVKVADCVPILFYDPYQKIVAVCHAGWKGTLEKIGGKIINKMQKKGSEPKNIIAVLGPHIGPCCYNITSERAKKFNTFLTNRNKKFFLDLGLANVVLLKKAGVKQIEELNICTSCRNDLLYSYRKEGQTHGEQVGLIGMT